MMCLLLGLLFVLALSGCTSGKASKDLELTAETKNANKTVLAYYKAQDVGSAEGDLYRAKMLECVRVHTDLDSSRPYTYYLYRIGIVPKTTQPVKQMKLQIYPTNGLGTLQVLPPQGADTVKYPPQSTFDMLNQWLLSYPSMDQYPDLDQTNVSNIPAYEVLFAVSNNSDEWQEEQSISNEALDKGMTTLRIEVDADGKKDTILLPLTGQLPIVDSKDDPLAVSNPYVMDILEEGGCSGYMSGFGEK